jgi:hypothetical protein
MFNKIRHSICGEAHKAVTAVRLLIQLRRIVGLANFAQYSGLPVVDMPDCPPNYPGFLDPNNEPRFIAVNRNLAPHEQAWFIARQVAFCAQQRGCDSLALNRPWKWRLLLEAPEEFRNKILALDQEYRAYWFMLFYATRTEYRPFVKQNRKMIFKISFTDNVVRYHLCRLWINVLIANIWRKLLMAASPAA